jgi:hypothetical protein
MNPEERPCFCQPEVVALEALGIQLLDRVSGLLVKQFYTATSVEAELLVWSPCLQEQHYLAKRQMAMADFVLVVDCEQCC